MPDGTLVPVDHQPDFSTHTLVPVDYDPFAAEKFANPAVESAISNLATLPQRAIQNSQYSLATGTYDPGPTLEAATLPMGTGAIAGVPVRGAEAVLGAGPIRAYHGSPHDFEAFDASKIGTGEGAQVYGYGLYFAEKEGVAKSYRDALAGSTVNGQEFNPANPLHQASALIDETGNRAAALDEIDKRIAADPGDDMHPRTRAMLLHRPEIPPIKSASGKMYEVNINADPEHMLNHDLDLRDHPPAVQSAVKGLQAEVLKKNPNSSFATAEDIETGGTLAARLEHEVGPDKAIDMLHQAGIPGIKYLDQGSRGAAGPPRKLWNGEWQVDTGQNSPTFATEAEANAHYQDLMKKSPGTSNYVVFNHDLINIVRKYAAAGIALPPAIAAEYARQFQPLEHNPFAASPR
jgi:hypothetical protein